MKSFDSLIDPETLASVQKAHELQALVSRTVPRAAAPHLVFCRLDDGQLRLTLDHASWLAKLRFSERQLIRDLAKAGIAVERISWHVAPCEQRPTPVRPRRARVPGPTAVAHLRALARVLNSEPTHEQTGDAAHVLNNDDALGRSLNRLADVLSRKSN
jgi:predicted nucleic acid-binding Zn ribbon protein